MSDCNFEWSMCATCSKTGSKSCPLENSRTIKDLKSRVDYLEDEIRKINN